MTRSLQQAGNLTQTFGGPHLLVTLRRRLLSSKPLLEGTALMTLEAGFRAGAFLRGLAPAHREAAVSRQSMQLQA